MSCVGTLVYWRHRPCICNVHVGNKGSLRVRASCLSPQKHRTTPTLLPTSTLTRLKKKDWGAPSETPIPHGQVGNRQWERVLEMVRKIRGLGMEVCTTLGMLTPDQVRVLGFCALGGAACGCLQYSRGAWGEGWLVNGDPFVATVCAVWGKCMLEAKLQGCRWGWGRRTVLYVPTTSPAQHQLRHMRHAKHLASRTAPGSCLHSQARELRQAGLTAYNHNLDTSPEYYSKV